MSQNKHWRVYLPTILGWVIGALFLGYVINVILGFIDQKPARPEKKIQPIQLLKPPPPPPPPPKVEKPPEPEVKEKIKEPDPEPEPEPEQPPPNQEVTTDQEAAAGDNGFGLKHGAGSSGPPGGGGTGSVERWYGGLIKNSILDILNDHEQLRRKAYSTYINVWVKPDGSLERIELSKGSGDEEIDALISRLLTKFKGLSEPPPPSMKQPVKLKVNSRV